jgi:hypothetical protein
MGYYLKQGLEVPFSFCIDLSDRVPHRRALQESVVTLEL